VTAAGVAVNRSTYAAFGLSRLEQLTVGNRLRWTAREWEASVSLQYNRYRHYLPSLGTFLQADPSDISDDPAEIVVAELNRFGYSASDPINNTDPNGPRMN
jgi:RHS repeat-associated protein